jgi:hypothetical protein
VVVICFQDGDSSGGREGGKTSRRRGIKPTKARPAKIAHGIGAL